MTIILILIIILALFLVLAAVIAISIWLQNRGDNDFVQQSYPGSPVNHAPSRSMDARPPASPDDLETLNSLVHELLANGMKLQAIKAYREITGADLRDAKYAVEAIERGEPVLPYAPINAIAPGDLEEQVRNLLRKGNKVAAIKLYMDATRSGLKESKDAVDAIEQRMRIS
ncbi:MAG: hypothetical protein AB1894_05755 [Chloroflexota bacterium]